MKINNKNKCYRIVDNYEGAPVPSGTNGAFYAVLNNALKKAKELNQRSKENYGIGYRYIVVEYNLVKVKEIRCDADD